MKERSSAQEVGVEGREEPRGRFDRAGDVGVDIGQCHARISERQPRQVARSPGEAGAWPAR